uniref:ARAD1A10373p n=1 Tax=Blastobotrys adeninivorans TaxID=409370 RepID=A0A060T2Q4_BLAAD
MRDSDRSQVHLRDPRIVEVFEEWMKSKVEFDDIIVPPEHEPADTDEDDELAPDQYAAFGIIKSRQKASEPVWKDLGLRELAESGPDVRPKLPR